ncbi:hypothetical protein SNEBB_004299 [Seison nebaliae]|nr:hypothetical protein SNEBB_004299 [Seison nebaliae]
MTKKQSVHSLDHLAQILLEEKFILTALEFHAELIERNKKVNRLQTYFSDPSNFERIACVNRNDEIRSINNLNLNEANDDDSISMMGESMKTYDSNDSVEQDTLLQFKLRKANETIDQLRNDLTELTNNQKKNKSEEISGKKLNETENITKETSLEKHIMNFLVNKYLIQFNYKLSSITFCEENDDENLDDWDAIGLNEKSPPDLLKLYRNYEYSSINQKKEDRQFIHRATSTNNEIDNPKILIDASTQTRSISTSHQFQQTLFNEQEKVEEFNSTKQNEVQQMKILKEYHITNNSEKKLDNISQSSNENGKNDGLEKEIKPISDNPEINIEENRLKEGKEINQIFNINRNSKKIYDKNLEKEKFVKENNEGNLEKEEEINSDGDEILNEKPLIEKDVKEANIGKNSRDVESYLHFYGDDELNLDEDLLMMIRNFSKLEDDWKLSNEFLGNFVRTVEILLPSVTTSKRNYLYVLLITFYNHLPNRKDEEKVFEILIHSISRPSMNDVYNGIACWIYLMKKIEIENRRDELIPLIWEELTMSNRLERKVMAIHIIVHLIPFVSSTMQQSFIISIIQQVIDDEDMEKEIILNILLIFIRSISIDIVENVSFKLTEILEEVFIKFFSIIDTTLAVSGKEEEITENIYPIIDYRQFEHRSTDSCNENDKIRLNKLFELVSIEYLNKSKFIDIDRYENIIMNQLKKMMNELNENSSKLMINEKTIFHLFHKYEFQYEFTSIYRLDNSIDLVSENLLQIFYHINNLINNIDWHYSKEFGEMFCLITSTIHIHRTSLVFILNEIFHKILLKSSDNIDQFSKMIISYESIDLLKSIELFRVLIQLYQLEKRNIFLHLNRLRNFKDKLIFIDSLTFYLIYWHFNTSPIHTSSALHWIHELLCELMLKENDERHLIKCVSQRLLKTFGHSEKIICDSLIHFQLMLFDDDNESIIFESFSFLLQVIDAWNEATYRRIELKLQTVRKISINLINRFFQLFRHHFHQFSPNLLHVIVNDFSYNNFHSEINNDILHFFNETIEKGIEINNKNFLIFLQTVDDSILDDLPHLSELKNENNQQILQTSPPNSNNDDTNSIDSNGGVMTMKKTFSKFRESAGDKFRFFRS